MYKGSVFYLNVTFLCFRRQAVKTILGKMKKYVACKVNIELLFDIMCAKGQVLVEYRVYCHPIRKGQTLVLISLLYPVMYNHAAGGARTSTSCYDFVTNKETVKCKIRSLEGRLLCDAYQSNKS